MDKNLLDAFAARARAKQVARTERKTFELPGIGPLPFQMLPREAMIDFMGRITEDAGAGARGASDLYQAQAELIFDCCPALQDVELQAALGVELDPYAIVPALMEMSEISDLSNKLMAWMGLMSVSDDNEEKSQKKRKKL